MDNNSSKRWWWSDAAIKRNKKKFSCAFKRTFAFYFCAIFMPLDSPPPATQNSLTDSFVWCDDSDDKKKTAQII